MKTLSLLAAALLASSAFGQTYTHTRINALPSKSIPDVSDSVPVEDAAGAAWKVRIDSITSLVLPSITGQTGKYLTNNGTALQWKTIGFPGQLVVTTAKTFTSLNTLTISGTDGSTLNIGTGGALGSAAYSDSTDYLAAGAIATTTEILRGDGLGGAEGAGSDVADYGNDASYTGGNFIAVRDVVNHRWPTATLGTPYYLNTFHQRKTDTVASSATPTINTDNVTHFSITALATAITSMTTNLSGTPNEGDRLIIWIKDNGTARAITWGASFAASSDLALPTTTTLGKYLYCNFIYNATLSKWVLLSKLDNI